MYLQSKHCSRNKIPMWRDLTHLYRLVHRLVAGNTRTDWTVRLMRISQSNTPLSVGSPEVRRKERIHLWKGYCFVLWHHASNIIAIQICTQPSSPPTSLPYRYVHHQRPSKYTNWSTIPTNQSLPMYQCDHRISPLTNIATFLNHPLFSYNQYCHHFHVCDHVDPLRRIAYIWTPKEHSVSVRHSVF